MKCYFLILILLLIGCGKDKPSNGGTSSSASSSSTKEWHQGLTPKVYKIEPSLSCQTNYRRERVCSPSLTSIGPGYIEAYEEGRKLMMNVFLGVSHYRLNMELQDNGTYLIVSESSNTPECPLMRFNKVQESPFRNLSNEHHVGTFNAYQIDALPDLTVGCK